MNPFAKSDSGFTLVEVLLAILVISIISSAFLQFFDVSISSIFASGQRTSAVYRIQEDLEKLYAIGASSNEDSVVIQFPSNPLDSSESDLPTQIIVKGLLVEDSVPIGREGHGSVTVFTFVPNND